jgi:hypothetical protein
MARHSETRESLLRDARALSPRVLLRLRLRDGEVELFSGFRGASLSLYFGDDPVYHFNANGELRRAHVHDELIKTERRQLIFMRRQQREGETALVRQPDDDAAKQSFLANMQRHLDGLRSAIAAKQYEVIGEEPSSGEALPRLIAWLDANRDINTAASPRVT